MDDTTFSALAERARAYPVVLRRSQMSKITLRARETAACRGREAPVLACRVCTRFMDTNAREVGEDTGRARHFASLA
ncbi:MAG TPA: hypothetical protein ENN52_01315 [Methanofollis liminatans]|uniref:Uncharacterized protein n=1 Tax=Methanofollis liminatans TaxID=2201 RepID=A0A831LTT7_9EURY|nr:hypothetical protein [Methanofollis liminatans]